MLIWPLVPGEVLLWQGRPAPRCYVFRGIYSIVAAIIVLLLSGGVLWWLRAANLSIELLSALLLLIIGSFAFGPGRLLYRRWRWESLFYAVTTERVLVCGADSNLCSYLLSLLIATKVVPYGNRLASIRLIFKDRSHVMLECLEEPHRCLFILERLTEEKPAAVSKI